MKKIILGMMAMLAVAITFTSCSDDDDNNGYSFHDASRYQRSEAYASLTKTGTSGTAKLYFQRYGAKVDSVENVTWNFSNDSTFVVSNVPDSVFAVGFANLGQEGLNSAIKAGTPTTTTITGNISYLTTNDNDMYVVVNPVASQIDVNYNGSTQKFRPMFVTGQYTLMTQKNGKPAFNMAFAGYTLGSTSAMLDVAVYYSVIAQ